MTSTLSQWAHISQTITTTKHNYVFFSPKFRLVRQFFDSNLTIESLFSSIIIIIIMLWKYNVTMVSDLIKSPPSFSQRNSELKRKPNIILCMNKSKKTNIVFILTQFTERHKLMGYIISSNRTFYSRKHFLLALHCA